MYNIDYKYAANYCRTNWSAESARIINIADDVCENTFLFDMPWDMERTAEPTHFDNEIDWNMIKNGDKEYLFQMNRHRYFIILAQAYQLTGDEKYTRCFVRLLTDFIDRVPVIRNGNDNPWRSLEVGLRGEYWTKAMTMLKKTPEVDEAVVGKYHSSLREHADILLKSHDAHKKLSNWGVIQDHGLFAIGIELMDNSIINTAIERLAEQSRLQLFSDGMHWEQSCMYHNEVLSCFLDVIIRARDKNILLPEELIENAHKMARVNLAWIMPHNKQPLFGDSDYTDIRDIMTVSAYLFNDAELKSKAYPILDYESIWLFGRKGAEEYEKMPSYLPTFTDVSLSDGGTHIMRPDWSEKSSYLIFHNGYSGSGHAHCDKLSFDLNLYGRDFITDTGRYTYVGSNKIRKYTRGAKGHNGIRVDHIDAAKCSGWSYFKLAPSIKQSAIFTDEYDLVSGAHLGYLRSFFPVVPVRKILWIKPDVYVILDTLYAKGYHRYTQSFHFAPDLSPVIEGKILMCENQDVSMRMQSLTAHSGWKLKDAVYSEHYNKKTDIKVGEISFGGCGTTVSAVVIAANGIKNGRAFSVKKLPVPSVSARGNSIAMEIKFGGDVITLFYTAKELMKCLTVNDKDFTAKLSYYVNDDYKVVEW